MLFHFFKYLFLVLISKQLSRMVFIYVFTDNYSNVVILPQISLDFTQSFLYILWNFVRNFLICLSHNISKDIEFKFAAKIMAPNFLLVLYAFTQVREFLGHFPSSQPVNENPSVRSFLLVWSPEVPICFFYVISFVSLLHSSFLLAWLPGIFSILL